ncbi:MAG: hypothetical protein ABI837_08245 [Acidobacteriota bacterium]
MSVHTTSVLNKVVSADRLYCRVGKNLVAVMRFPAQIRRGFGFVDADRYRLDTRCPQLRQMLFNTP